MKITIVLSCNVPHSHTKNAWMLSKELCSLGHSITILFPIVDFYQAKLFSLKYSCYHLSYVERAIVRAIFLFRLIVELTIKSRRKFAYSADSTPSDTLSPHLRRYCLLPSRYSIPKADFTLVFQDYLLEPISKIECKITGIVVGSIHTDYEQVKNVLGVGSYESEMLKIAKKHAHIPRFAVSKQAGTAAKKNGLRCDVVITNGVDPEFFVTRQSKNGTSSRLVRLKILFYCSSRPEKGISSVKLALPIIRQTLGFGKHLYASIGSVEAGDLTNFDINYGFLNGKEYQDAISSCDIFVYPSFFDGFPAPPLEAMASSVALVTTLVTGVDEWAINGENCLTVSPQNHAELAKAVCLLARDDALRWRISAKGRVVAERYKWRTSAKSLINFLDSIVDQS